MLHLVVGVFPLDISDDSCALVLDTRVHHLVGVSLVLIEDGVRSTAT